MHINHRKGLLVTAIGGLVLSFDIPLIRLAYGDPWPILMLRSATTFAAAFVIWGIWRVLSPNAPSLVPGWLGAIVAALYGVGSMAFVTAVYTTSTANLVFILAFTTMFAALLSWIFLDEHPRRITLVTMAVMVLGVLIIVFDGLGSGQVFGDLLALCSALCIAGAITISRHSGRDMGFTALVGVILPLAVAVFFVAKTGYRVDAPWWIVFNGAVVMPISFFCLANGPKYLSGAEVAMFYLLETVLAPVWVWLIFTEVPSPNALIGGTILIVALVAHSIWQLADGRRRTRALAMAAIGEEATSGRT
jgi:drug/metabolite transporter (DMT)-like permease